MTKQPLSDEERKRRSEQMKARWAAKKAEEQQNAEPTPPEDAATAGAPAENAEDTQPEPGELTPVDTPDSPSDEVEPDTPPKPEETTPAASVGRALENAEAAREAMRIIRYQYPDMIESKQAVDALDEAIARMGQVKGILFSK